jgi:hypothetical protein
LVLKRSSRSIVSRASSWNVGRIANVSASESWASDVAENVACEFSINARS